MYLFTNTLFVIWKLNYLLLENFCKCLVETVFIYVICSILWTVDTLVLTATAPLYIALSKMLNIIFEHVRNWLCFCFVLSLALSDREAQVQDSDTMWWCYWWWWWQWLVIHAYANCFFLKGNTFRLFNLKCIILLERSRLLPSYSMHDHFNALITFIVHWYTIILLTLLDY